MADTGTATRAHGLAAARAKAAARFSKATHHGAHRPRLHHRGSKLSEEMQAAERPTVYQRIQRLLDDPTSSPSARIFMIVSTFLVITSVVMLTLSTMPDLRDSWIGHIHVEWFFSVIFSVELIVRVAIAHNPLEAFMNDLYLVFDAVAVVPFWLQLLYHAFHATPENNAISMMKAFRMFRLLKLTRQYGGSIVIARVLRVSMVALCVPSFFLGVAVIVFASFLYYAENVGGEETYASIPDAIWYIIVPLSTNGGGDNAPVTTMGKFVTAMAMIFGVIFLSMPLAIVGNNFCTTWTDRSRVIFIEEFRMHCLGKHFTRADLTELFRELDADDSGTLTIKELRIFCSRMHFNIPNKQLIQVWQTIDVDGSGEIGLAEFIELFEKDNDDTADDEKDDGVADEADFAELEGAIGSRASPSGLSSEGAFIETKEADAGAVSIDLDSGARTARGGGAKGDSSIQAQLSKMQGSFEDLLLEQVRLSQHIEVIMRSQRAIQGALVKSGQMPEPTPDLQELVCGSSPRELNSPRSPNTYHW